MEKRLRIGFFIDTFFPMVDGVIMTVDNYAKHLSKVADVTVFTTVADRHYVDDRPYRVVRSWSVSLANSDYRIPLPDFDPGFHLELKKAELDIIHIHSPFAVGKAGARYAKEHGIPAIVTIHSQYKLEFQRALKLDRFAEVALRDMVRLYDGMDERWAVNAELGRVYHEEYGGAEITTVRGNATDMCPVADRAESRARVNLKYGLRDEEKVFLFVGRLNLLKNILFIVDALKIFRARCEIPFRMLFVGTGQDEDKLRKKIDEADLWDRVSLCGRIDDRGALADVYARADLFLFPSLFDSNSLVQIEAASQRTPALFIRGSVTGSTVQDGVDGFFADNDPEGYARRMIEILRDPVLRETAAEGALRNIYRTWEETVAAAYADYLRLAMKKLGREA